MKMLATCFVLVLAVPGVAGSSTPPPDNVVVILQGALVETSWTPVAGASYNVYGLPESGAAPVLLASTAATTAAVSPGYVTYGVASVDGSGQESPIQYAGQCVLIQPTKNPPVLIYDC